jgi:hypothetical protein
LPLFSGIIDFMDVSTRKWWIRIGDTEKGPLTEDEFQNQLRAGEISLKAEVKSSLMSTWEPLLAVVSSDKTFRRRSTVPPNPSDAES